MTGYVLLCTSANINTSSNTNTSSNLSTTKQTSEYISIPFTRENISGYLEDDKLILELKLPSINREEESKKITLENCKKEITMRKNDIIQLEKDIATLNQNIEDNHDSLGDKEQQYSKDILDFRALIGKHKKSIKDLYEKETKFNYNILHTSYTCEILSNKITKLPEQFSCYYNYIYWSNDDQSTTTQQNQKSTEEKKENSLIFKKFPYKIGDELYFTYQKNWIKGTITNIDYIKNEVHTDVTPPDKPNERVYLINVLSNDEHVLWIRKTKPD